MMPRPLTGTILGFFAFAGLAQAQETEPLSAIDWLSQSVQVPASASQTGVGPFFDEPPVSNNASTPEITVTPLDGAGARIVGVLPSSQTGLPETIWANSAEATLVGLIQAELTRNLPALHDLLVTLMLAKAERPALSSATDALLLARIDKLLDQGALVQARSLIEAAGYDDPAVYRRAFDVSLLTGTENEACALLRSRPTLAPTYPARIFCTARNGDWNGAALTLNTARALGDVSDEEDALLSRFLDPAISDGAAPLPPPSRPSPLVFLMREAIGEALPTSNLPLAFAHADLRATVAWRTQMEAAERLAREQAIAPSVLLAAYTKRTPAASGGVWDRAEAIQRFDVAIRARDTGAVTSSLADAWSAMLTAQTEVAFATLYAPALAGLPLTGEAARLARTIGLLSPDYEAAAQPRPDDSAQDRFLAAIARGDVRSVPVPAQAGAAAVHAAFAGAPVPAALTQHLEAGRLGEALLRAIAAFGQGAAGDYMAITDALATFRAVGLEEVARRAALQYLILDRLS